MQYDAFVGQVQHRARLASSGDAVRAIRATLETLAERLTAEESKDLASQLPREIGLFLHQPREATGQRFHLEEFFKRVNQREQVDPADAVFHARVVFEVLGEAVSRGEMQDVIAQLPAEFQPFIEAGSHGALKK